MIPDQVVETRSGAACCISDRITVQQAKRYAQIMRDLEDAPVESAKAAVMSMTRLLPDVYGTLRAKDVIAAEVTQVITAAKTLHFTMQEVVLPKFAELSEPETEQQASVFDEYDKEEGYDEPEGGNLWETCLESIDVITQAAIKIMRQSYSDTMKEELVPLIEHLKWEIDHQPRRRTEGG